MYRSPRALLLARAVSDPLHRALRPTCSPYCTSGPTDGNGGNGGDLTTSTPKVPTRSFGNCRECDRPLKPTPTLTRKLP